MARILSIHVNKVINMYNWTQNVIIRTIESVILISLISYYLLIIRHLDLRQYQFYRLVIL